MSDRENSGLRSVPNLRLRGDINSEEVPLVAESQSSEEALDPFVQHLLFGRNVCEATDIRNTLDPRLSHLPSPETMAGHRESVELLVEAYQRGWRVAIFGDYDVDGVSSAAILATYLRDLGLDLVVCVAHRNQGYGFTIDEARRFIELSARLVITVDCGTSDREALQELRDRGVCTLVIDHHQVPQGTLVSDSMLNPHRTDCSFPFKGMCSAGITFYLCASLRSRILKLGLANELPDPRSLLDLVALGTVCDMVPLRGINRILVSHGLRRLNTKHRPGISALLERSGIENHQVIDEVHIGFQLGPRINAPGRFGSAAPALELLQATTLTEARAMAQRIEVFNVQRREHQKMIFAQACEIIESDPVWEERSSVVVANPNWLPGVVGIAASALAQRYRRPSAVISIAAEGLVARGSIRSYGQIDVHAALCECSSILDRFGGHRAAAGFSLSSLKIDEFKEAFDLSIAKLGSSRSLNLESEFLEYDGRLSPSRLDTEVLEAIRFVGPYGMDFPEPRFLGENLRVLDKRIVQQQHLSLTLEHEAKRFSAIAFGQAFESPSIGEEISCVYFPQRSTFRGKTRIELRVEKIWCEPP